MKKKDHFLMNIINFFSIVNLKKKKKKNQKKIKKKKILHQKMTKNKKNIFIIIKVTQLIKMN